MQIEIDAIDSTNRLRLDSPESLEERPPRLEVLRHGSGGEQRRVRTAVHLTTDNLAVVGAIHSGDRVGYHSCEQRPTDRARSARRVPAAISIRGGCMLTIGVAM